LKKTGNKPGRAYVGIVSRLDAMTSGVLVLARTSKAASRLSAQFADKSAGDVKKLYLAVVEGQLESEQGEFVDFVRKDDNARRMRVVDSVMPGAQQARLRYLRIGMHDDASAMAIQLLTGRKHQIRVQFSERGYPILGDRKYGSARRFSAGVALHSWRLQIVHPTKREPMWFEAETPISWKTLHRILPQEFVRDDNRDTGQVTSELRTRIAEVFDLPSNDAP
jgi:23S rRNA pseudouridine1911/1915/1917 synthase